MSAVHSNLVTEYSPHCIVAQARSEAAAVDAAAAAGKDVGPLCGLPIGVKVSNHIAWNAT